MKRMEEEDGTIQQAAPQALSISQLSSVSMIEKWLQWMEDNDHSADHSRFVLHGIESYLEP